MIVPGAESMTGTAGTPSSIGITPSTLNNDSVLEQGKNPDASQDKPDTSTENKPIQKPDGLPDNWIEKPSRDGIGKEWVNPDNPNDRVRVMPANPEAKYPTQQVPYVIDQNGGYRDINGNPIPGNNPGDTPEAHIPASNFKFRR